MHKEILSYCIDNLYWFPRPSVGWFEFCYLSAPPFLTPLSDQYSLTSDTRRYTEKISVVSNLLQPLRLDAIT